VDLVARGGDDRDVEEDADEEGEGDYGLSAGGVEQEVEALLGLGDGGVGAYDFAAAS